MKPITNRSAWFGSELPIRPDWQRQLSGPMVDECLGGDAQKETSDSPLVEFFESIRNELETGSGATLVKGFPIDSFDTEQLRNCFLKICGLVGTAVSQSATGEKVFDVRDAGFGDSDPRARGPNTKKKLSFHTDRCDVIAFLCVRPAKVGGENYLVSSSAIYNQLLEEHPELLAELMEPFFYKRHTVDPGNPNPFCRQPVFSFREGHFACSFLRVLIDRAYGSGEVPPLTETQLRALDQLEEIAEQERMQHRFYLERGDLLFLNNWTTLHRRTEFEDHDAPELKRHLLRVWLSVPNSRPIDPLFVDNFGATEAGAIRGGMRAVSE